MTAKKSMNSSDSQQTQLKGISVISLDALKPTEKLLPGETHEIAKGVSVSVMQSAAEALLEIQESASGSISIDNHPAHELATVRPGQIIKTAEGRYVLIRHLHAIIVPRHPGYRRPEHVESMIALAAASLAAPVSNIVEPSDDSVMNTPVTSCASNKTQIKTSKRIIRLALLGSAVAVVAGLCIGSFSQEQLETTSVATSQAKSRVVAVAEQSQSVVKNALEPKVEPEVEAKATGETTQTPDAQKTEQVSAVDALRTAMTMPASGKKSPTTSINALRKAVEAPSPNAARLSEKDRQTIIEYKLEAKFDRTKARIKLQDMAKSFPAGSPARVEVERVAASM